MQMKLKKTYTLLIHSFLITLLMVTNARAADVTVLGSIPHTLKQSDTTSVLRSNSNNKNTDKEIKLLRIELSEAKKQELKSRSKQAITPINQLTNNNSEFLQGSMPSKRQLGMNKVPVLDQGIHGTCVTFAITGAIDASMGKGDYISQLCNLQLGSYLELHGYGYSGWDGSFAINVINQMEQYGIVNTQKQRNVGCGGLTRYPTYSSHNPKSFIEPEKYHSMSEQIFGTEINWSDVYQKENPEQSLIAVKEALNAGDRLVFAFMIPRTDLGMVGAVGKNQTWFYSDSWVLTPEILKGVNSIEAAHEMIITGYDDNAVAVDTHGKNHKGLLMLRNSWGTSVGDYGEFYMSYDYFKLLAFDITRFTKPSL